MPQLGQPIQTLGIDEINPPINDFGNADPIPPLTDPPAVTVARPVDEPLVELSHDRMVYLNSYGEAGWKHACDQAFVREQVADRLYAIAEELPAGWGLATFDVWRSIDLQQELFDALQLDPTAPSGLIAEPNRDPANPPPHATGGAVDLTLTWQGTPLGLGTGFDDITSRAQIRHFEAVDGLIQQARRHLFHLMGDAGFVVFPHEWWHWEWGTGRWAAIRNLTPLYAAISP